MKHWILALTLVAVSAQAAPNPRAIVNRDKGYRSSDIRVLSFGSHFFWSGFEWEIKQSGSDLVGPGPNYFSDSPDNVWIDDDERLHLRITRERGRYYCAEVRTVEPLSYGSYSWIIESDVDNLDPNAVLGLFTWSDSSLEANGEIDIEFSRWGDSSNPNAQYVVQPYFNTGHLLPFDWLTTDLASLHSFTWTPNVVDFASWVLVSPNASLIQDWTFPDETTVPPFIPSATGTEHARMNLWLFRGDKPQNRKGDLEVIIGGFNFTPIPPR